MPRLRLSMEVGVIGVRKERLAVCEKGEFVPMVRGMSGDLHVMFDAE